MVKIQVKSGEVLILLAASVMSLLANLPDRLLGNLVDRRALLAALMALVVVAMFRYLQVLLLLTISILAIGANLPTELASALGISKLALLISLGSLIAIALLNRVVKLLPTEKDLSHTGIADARQTMLEAIAKGDRATLQRLLVMHADVNFTLGGTTPLHLAAERGYPDMVQTLIGYGADYRIKNALGQTPLEVARGKKKFVKTEEVLHGAGTSYFAKLGQEETRRADADIWQKQHG
ncbi:ankyrin repeat protein [mine drainage metagenome]|uniref:Ankyrin repeat protein n=1 Tax=mine drainage metagenome TaxID=410659 RepID=A0A1J5S9N9_9ZZZZ